jgi:DNA-binding transcriptional ArsR family regulator
MGNVAGGRFGAASRRRSGYIGRMPAKSRTPGPDGPNDRCEIDSFDPKKVAAARKLMLPADEIERMSSIFQCVAHPTRIKIIQALFTGELCVCDLAQVLGSSVSAVSHQLRTLRALRLVKYRREGKMAYYSIDDEHVRALFALGLEHVRHG